jgi:hypothetical protein
VNGFFPLLQGRYPSLTLLFQLLTIGEFIAIDKKLAGEAFPRCIEAQVIEKFRPASFIQVAILHIFIDIDQLSERTAALATCFI